MQIKPLKSSRAYQTLFAAGLFFCVAAPVSVFAYGPVMPQPSFDNLMQNGRDLSAALSVALPPEQSQAGDQVSFSQTAAGPDLLGALASVWSGYTTVLNGVGEVQAHMYAQAFSAPLVAQVAALVGPTEDGVAAAWGGYVEVVTIVGELQANVYASIASVVEMAAQEMPPAAVALAAAPTADPVVTMSSTYEPAEASPSATAASAPVYADELCAKRSDGGYVCVTGDELATLLAQEASAHSASP